MLKLSADLQVRVFNDGENVFEGVVKDFIEINEYDEDTIDFVNGLESKEEYKRDFVHSGEWIIERA
jgi:hypothetical protein